MVNAVRSRTRDARAESRRRGLRARRRAAALTLVELLVGTMLMGVVMAAAGAMLLQAFGNESAYREQNAAQVAARAAADAISDDARGAEKGGFDPNYSAPTPLRRREYTVAGSFTAADPFGFFVYNDAGARRRVRYWLANAVKATQGGNTAYVTYLMRELDADVGRTAGVGGVAVACVRDPAPNPLTAAAIAQHVGATYDATTKVLTVVVACEHGTAPAASSTRVRADVVVRNTLK